MLPVYLDYWGLKEPPFVLAPNPRLFYMSDQHRQSLQGLKSAIQTGKGGALLVSEHPGNGKTTTLRMLASELLESAQDSLRVAFLDYPSLTPVQMMGEIARQLGIDQVRGDTVADLNALRSLIARNLSRGIHSLVIVDDCHMMVEQPDLMQEFRILLNFCATGDVPLYFILSGQAALEPAVRAIPDFWQRLPERFFLKNLDYENTCNLIRHRTRTAGATRDLFTEAAMEGIYFLSQGCPEVICAAADQALAVGFEQRVRHVDFAEVTRACKEMEHRGASYHYVARMEERPYADARETLSASAPPWREPAAPSAPSAPSAWGEPAAPGGYAMPATPATPPPARNVRPVPPPGASMPGSNGMPVTPPVPDAPVPAPKILPARPETDVEVQCDSCGTQILGDNEACAKCGKVVKVACGRCKTMQSVLRKACARCSFPLTAWARGAEQEFLAGLKRINLYSSPKEADEIKFQHYRSLEGRVLYFAGSGSLFSKGARVREVGPGRSDRSRNCGVIIGNSRLVFLIGDRVVDIPLQDIEGCELMPATNHREAMVMIAHDGIRYEVSFPVKDGRRAAFHHLLSDYISNMSGVHA